MKMDAARPPRRLPLKIDKCRVEVVAKQNVVGWQSPEGGRKSSGVVKLCCG